MKKIITLLTVFASFYATGQTIWDGGSFTFTKTVPFQQDCITPGVCLTRGSLSVLYNETTENFLDGDGDCDWTPGNTEWAYGNIANWATLTYENLYDLNNCVPPSMVNQPIVLHLINEDIYLQLTFSYWGSASSNGNFTYTRTTQSTLSVKLISFEAKNVNGTVQLHWTTESEKDNKGFYVQRSKDGRTFDNLSFIGARQNITGTVEYSYTDAAPLNGVSYYRLQALDNNGSRQSSKIVRQTIQEQEKVSVFPNPVTSSFHVNGADFSTAYATVRNNIGIVVKQGILHNGSFDIADLPPGLYHIQISNDRNNIAQVLMKQ